MSVYPVTPFYLNLRCLDNRDSLLRMWGADCEAYAEGLVRPGRPGEIAEITQAVFDLDVPLEGTNGCRPAG